MIYYYDVNRNEKLREVEHGLVDYVKNGYYLMNGEKIPCEVGFIDMGTVIKATHLFVKDGVTENGTHYYKETIEI